MAKANATPPAKQFVATLPFRSEQIGDPDANYDVSVWRGTDLVCEKRSHSPCDTSGLFYGSAEDEVTKFCARHFYEMHGEPGPTYRLVDPPEHSPGPWTVMVSPGDVLYVDNGHRRIADLWGDGITPEENSANARILGSALELLDVCREVREVGNLAVRSGDRGDSEAAMGALVRLANKARDVVARATDQA